MIALRTSSFASGYLTLCLRAISEAWRGSAPRKSSEVSWAGEFSAISLSFSSLAWQPGHPLNHEPIGGRRGLPALPCGRPSLSSVNAATHPPPSRTPAAHTCHVPERMSFRLPFGLAFPERRRKRNHSTKVAKENEKVHGSALGKWHISVLGRT